MDSFASRLFPAVPSRSQRLQLLGYLLLIVTAPYSSAFQLFYHWGQFFQFELLFPQIERPLLPAEKFSPQTCLQTMKDFVRFECVTDVVQVAYFMGIPNVVTFERCKAHGWEALLVVCARLGHPGTLNELSSHIGMSGPWISKIFKGTMG